MPEIATRYPSPANFRAIARPIPEPPPVTHITGEALLLTPGCRGMIRGKLHSCG
jgi:hypothetical protein